MSKKINVPKIPFLSLPDTALSTTSWEQVPIADITDDIVLFKDGGAAVIMEASSLNFSLLSEKEQEAVVAAYAGLLNSLSFPIQIVIRSQRKDISKYLKNLEDAKKKINNPKLIKLMDSYRNFILTSIKKKNVLGKKFYIIIPFSPLELGVTKSITTAVKGKGPLPFPKEYVVKKAKIALYPKRDHFLRQVTGFGIKVKQYNNEQLINLYYLIYNQKPPAIKEKKKEENV